MIKLLCALALASPFMTAAETRFKSLIRASINAGPVTGRVYVMISRTNSPEPRLQVGRVGIPFFGRDVEKLAAGVNAAIDATDVGSPVVSLSEIPPGEYWVQGFVNVYSEFRRSMGTSSGCMTTNGRVSTGTGPLEISTAWPRKSRWTLRKDIESPWSATR